MLVRWVRELGHGGHTGLVESDVTVFTNTSEEEVDSTCVFDLLLVWVAFADEILYGSVEDVDLGGWDVDVREEVCEPKGI